MKFTFEIMRGQLIRRKHGRDILLLEAKPPDGGNFEVKIEVPQGTGLDILRDICPEAETSGLVQIIERPR